MGKLGEVYISYKERVCLCPTILGLGCKVFAVDATKYSLGLVLGGLIPRVEVLNFDLALAELLFSNLEASALAI